MPAWCAASAARTAATGWRAPADDITLADVIRAVEGPLASVRGASPEELKFDGRAEPLGKVWVAVRANLRAVLESVTLADIAGGELPGPDRRAHERPRGLGHALTAVATAGPPRTAKSWTAGQ